MFYYIINTTYQKNGDLFCPQYVLTLFLNLPVFLKVNSVKSNSNI